MEGQENNNIPEEYQPISMWGYIGYGLLFAIPCVGFIVLLIFAFGGTKNINLRNWARGQLILYVIMFVLGFILSTVLVGSVGTLVYNAARQTSYYARLFL